VDLPVALAGKALDVVTTLNQLRRRVRVRVHRAYFSGSLTEHYFINLTNLSAKRDVVVTHIWFSDPAFHVINPARPLPRRLTLDETWETWVPVALIGDGGETRARVRLSNGKVVRSRRGRPPPFGSVPGEPAPGTTPR
jgi:hypothetical protein